MEVMPLSWALLSVFKLLLQCMILSFALKLPLAVDSGKPGPLLLPSDGCRNYCHESQGLTDMTVGYTAGDLDKQGCHQRQQSKAEPQ